MGNSGRFQDKIDEMGGIALSAACARWRDKYMPAFCAYHAEHNNLDAPRSHQTLGVLVNNIRTGNTSIPVALKTKSMKWAASHFLRRAHAGATSTCRLFVHIMLNTTISMRRDRIRRLECSLTTYAPAILQFRSLSRQNR